MRARLIFAEPLPEGARIRLVHDANDLPFRVVEFPGGRVFDAALAPFWRQISEAAA